MKCPPTSCTQTQKKLQPQSKNSPKPFPKVKNKRVDSTIAPLLSPLELFNQTATKTQINAIESSQEVHALVEKIVDKEQEMTTKGIREITLKVDLPSFENCEVTLLEYDTAPRCLQIQLAGSPEQQAFFSHHLAHLNAHLSDQIKANITLLSPKLSQSYRKREVKKPARVR